MQILHSGTNTQLAPYHGYGRQCCSWLRPREEERRLEGRAVIQNRDVARSACRHGARCRGRRVDDKRDGVERRHATDAGARRGTTRTTGDGLGVAAIAVALEHG